MPAWAEEAAALVGLDPTDVLQVEADGAQPFGNAAVMPAIDFLGPEAARILRRRFWENAGVDTAQPPSRRLLIMRRGQTGRRSFSEPELRRAA